MNLEGNPKQTKRGVAEIRFDVKPESVGKLEICISILVLMFLVYVLFVCQQCVCRVVYWDSIDMVYKGEVYLQDRYGHHDK